MSDKTEPITYYNEPIGNELDRTDNQNPFIIEGQLYCEEKQLSYSIKYVDGKYIITEYNLETFKNEICDEKEYIPNRIPAYRIIFKQYWKQKVDELCENMEVLIPGAFVFVGFKNYVKGGEIVWQQ
jgi:CRISPR type III-associated protein (TIGR04423 family)